MNNKRVAIFAHFDKNNIIQDYVVYYLKNLKNIVDYLIFVSDSNISNQELKKINNYIDFSIIGSHGEYDFGSYKRGYLHLVNNNLLSCYDKLILANDSCYAPIFPFKQMFEKMEKKNFDFWGITADRIMHFKEKLIIQSFFLVFNKNVFISEVFDNFMNSIKKEKDKASIVKKYEQGFTLALEKAGYSWDVYSQYSKKHWQSGIIDHEIIVVKEHCPTIKRSFILGSMPHLFSMKRLKNFIENNTNYDYILIWNDYLNNKVKPSIKHLFKAVYKTIGRKIIRFLQNFIIYKSNMQNGDDGKKLLIIHEYFTHSQKNGANIIAFNTYYAIKKKGINCYFYSNNEGTLIEEQDINEYFPKSHINTNAFLYRLNSLYNYSAEKNLRKVIKKLKPDIIHIHSLLELSHSTINAIKQYKIPYVITVHDAMYVCPIMGGKQQYCTLCSENVFNCVKNKCSRNNYFNSLYMAIKFFINKQIIKSYEPSCIITPSKALMNYINQTRFSKDIKACVIPNSLDKAFLEVIPNYKNEGYFLFVGNLLDGKGVNILLEAINNLPKDIEVHLVGDGLQRDKYEVFIKENLLKNVKLKGKKNREELIKEYQNCIATILPSNCFDNFPTISLESFINGKPVIGSNIGGIPEQVEHNKTGLLFEPANVEQLKECILKYWNNPSLVIEHGRNAYEKAKTQYTEERYYSELIQVYNEVLERDKK